MSHSKTNNSAIVLAGLGSPHGDDQVGWRIAELLKRRVELTARVEIVREATELLESLSNCRRLIIVDACRSGNEIGYIIQTRWPELRFFSHRHRSTHGLSVADALRLAERLGRLPQIVDIYGIEIEDDSPRLQLSPAVMAAACKLEALLFDEMSGRVHA